MVAATLHVYADVDDVIRRDFRHRMVSKQEKHKKKKRANSMRVDMLPKAFFILIVTQFFSFWIDASEALACQTWTSSSACHDKVDGAYWCAWDATKHACKQSTRRPSDSFGITLVGEDGMEMDEDVESPQDSLSDRWTSCDSWNDMESCQRTRSNNPSCVWNEEEGGCTEEMEVPDENTEEVTGFEGDYRYGNRSPSLERKAVHRLLSMIVLLVLCGLLPG